jgi:endonuclease YncB( thermonuclease family)
MIVRAILLLLALTQADIASEAISGKAHVVDGDTLEIASIKIRLQGIESPAEGFLASKRIRLKPGRQTHGRS